LALRGDGGVGGFLNAEVSVHRAGVSVALGLVAWECSDMKLLRWESPS
jgi:hypothetical protein